MVEYKVTVAQEGMKCIKLCGKILPNASTGFLYKMLRKKNITLNDKKADGTEILKSGDSVKFYFADETFAKFHGENVFGTAKTPSVRQGDGGKKVFSAAENNGGFKIEPERILYEDADVLIYNKPAGLLSQKAKAEDVSLNELLLEYVVAQSQYCDKTNETERKDTFNKQEKNPAETIPENKITTKGNILSIQKPSICNRLDRNTSGIVLFGKSYLGLVSLNQMLKERCVQKYYQCIVKGKLTESVHLNGYLEKNEKTNTVRIYKNDRAGAAPIETAYRPVKSSNELTLLEVHLITGKPHQIRAHLASIGHPILGDFKYTDRTFALQCKQKYEISYQLLHAYRVEFPDAEDCPQAIRGKSFMAPKPEVFERLEARFSQV